MHYFSGSNICKLDSKNRFVLPIHMRNGLIERGELKFALGIGLGGCLAIYRSALVEEIVNKLRSQMHLAKYQKFFTLFFSTLHKTTCDAIGRVHIPPLLKKAADLHCEIVVAGVMDKIEIWSRESYESNLQQGMQQADLQKMSEEGFALLHQEFIEGAQAKGEPI